MKMIDEIEMQNNNNNEKKQQKLTRTEKNKGDRSYSEKVRAK